MKAKRKAAQREERGTLFVVSTPIGNLGDLTHRAIEVLRACETVLAEDTRRTRILLAHYEIEPRELRSYHKHNEAARAAEVREILARGGSVALVSDSGTPLVSDPGFRLVRAALDLGARVVPVPGPSAALAALVASGLEPQPFTFFGFVPRAGRGRRQLLSELAGLRHTAIFFESPQRLARTLADLAERLDPARWVVVARELTKIHEEFISGTLSEVAAQFAARPPRGEVVVCLAGAGEPPEGSAEGEALELARSLARAGASARDIARALRERFGLERNRAYALALEVAGGDGSASNT
jgi:16S rRNA (cytidine1402-2'-O)-methyltransferase